MNHIIFNCTAITPVLSTGANRNMAELRPPEIKALMRFWWRAMHPHLTLERLREEEGTLFGACEKGKSLFFVRITDIKQKGRSTTPLIFRPDKDVSKMPPFPCIDAGSTFTILLTGSNNMHRYLNILAASLILGGIGKRSRRGYGSIRIDAINGVPFEYGNSLETLFGLIDKVSHDTFTFTGNEIEYRDKGNEASFPCIMSVACGKVRQKWDEVIRHVMIHASANNSYFTGFAEKIPPQTGKNMRMASPVYVSLAPSGTGYIPIVTTLQTEFEPTVGKYIHQNPEYYMCKRERAQKFIEGILS